MGMTEGDVAEELNSGRYECPECPERFFTMGDKRRHMRDQHPQTT